MIKTFQGDSGGPLVTKSKRGPYVIVGITSFGSGCVGGKLPNVFARVKNYNDWILSGISIT